MSADPPPPHVPSLGQLLSIARVALTFGEVDRTTMHADGVRFESDTTHTVMLAMVAAEYARALGLDPMVAVAYAMVHDLPETYAKDTCTAWGLTEEQKSDKAKREEAATRRLHLELGPHSVVMEWLRAYEGQEAPEARLVRYLDKVLPKLTHILNGGAALEYIGMSPKEAAEKHSRQNEELAAEYPEFAATVGASLDRAGKQAVNALGARILTRAAQDPSPPPHPSLRATPGHPCESCGAEDGNTLVEGWYRCTRCGYPSK